MPRGDSGGEPPSTTPAARPGSTARAAQVHVSRNIFNSTVKLMFMDKDTHATSHYLFVVDLTNLVYNNNINYLP